MWCLAEGRLRYFIELLCLIRFSREPSILRQSPGCLHHAMLSPGIFKTPTGVHASVLCSHEFWLNVNIFPVSVHAGSWSCQWHNKVCSEHHQYRNKQRYWQPCILFAHKNRSLSHITTSIIFKLSVLFIFSWLISKMVFAERGETISGGNFHGEYPAKVRMCLFFLSVCCSFFGFLRHTFFSRRLWTFYLLQSMSWPLSVRGGLKGCVTPLWVSCRPSWSMRVDSIQASWLHIVLLLHWVGAHDKLILHLLN